MSKIGAQKKVFFSLTFFTFEVPFYSLFAPTSKSRMSNIFRDFESLGKSNGKKWSQIWTFVFENFLKSPRKKSLFLLILPWSTLLWHRCYYPHRSRDALSPVCGIFVNNIIPWIKLDWVATLMTDPPPISSTTLSKKRKRKRKWHMIHDMWHVTRDTWHMTHDMWHVTRDMWHVWGGEHSLKASAP